MQCLSQGIARHALAGYARGRPAELVSRADCCHTRPRSGRWRPGLEERPVQHSPSNDRTRAGETGRAHLSTDEVHRLTLFKWRYTLEALGFAGGEVDDLMFLAWLHATSRLPR